MLKKIFITLSLFIILLIGAVLAVPYLFKDKLTALAKDEMNTYLNAEANFQSVSISIIKDFPNLSFGLEGLTIVNQAPFEGDTLANIGSLGFSIDILPILQSNKVHINSISISDPTLRVKVLKDGTANYDIVKATDAPEQETSTDTTSSDIQITLQSYKLENANVYYQDEAGELLAIVENLNHSGNGDFTLEQFDLNTKTTIEALTVESEGVEYLKEGSLELDLNTYIDLAKKRYQIKENRLKINALELRLSGVIEELPESAYNLDLQFNTPSTDFKALLSMIPAIYLTDFQDLKASGNLELNGDVKGIYKEEQYPAFNLDLNVNNGFFQYPDLPAAVKDVVIDLIVSNPGGSLNSTVIDLRSLAMKLGQESVKLKARVEHPITDPIFDIEADAKVNLANVKNYYPLEEQLSGNLDMALKAKGKVSTIEAERYEEFDAKGRIGITNMLYESADLPVAANVKDLQLTFNPNNVDLTNLAVKMGKSDIKAAGELENVFAYALGSGKLKGSLALASQLIDLNELMAATETEPTDVETSEVSTTETTEEAFELPEDIEFNMTATVAKIVMDNAELKNAKGNLVLSPRRLDIENISADVLNGSVGINGFLLTPEMKNPYLDFTYNISNLSIKEAYKTFNTVQTIAPIGKYLEGTFSSNFHLITELTPELELIDSTVNGEGKVDVRNAQLSGFKGIDKIADKLKVKELKELKIARIMTVLEILDGRVYVEPFDFKVRDIKMDVSGSHGLDNSLDYKILATVPSTYLKGARDYVGGLIDKANIPGVSSSALPSELVFNIGMGGTMDDPKISVGLASEKTESSMKDQAKEAFEQKKKELEKKAREEAERLKREAEEKARKEAERLKREAEERARQEAEKAKKRAEEKAREEAEKIKQETKDKAKDKAKDLFGPK